ncbi:MAG: serine/threonine protein kinase, partial [Actinobacteria bacterium]|nr:serine/threonine protein kinase [Actinomycetota bacterium]
MERPLILNRYRPLEKKAQGGFSIVEVAWDTRIQRRVAIKRIPLSKTSPSHTPGLAEARTAAMLSNPFIVQVLDFETDADEAFLIMEYIDGSSLAGVIDLEEGMLDLDEAACVVAAIAEALEFAHENQVLHLDIKPDNILIDYNGRVKVADFGMAELTGIAGYGQAQGGTIGYMPPEQIMRTDLDRRTDVWAFASVVYEMLTGENPFWSNNIELSLETIEEGDITPPSAFRDDLDQGIDDVLLTALSPERDTRQSSIAEFVDELLPFLGDAKEGRAALKDLLAPQDTDEDEEALEHLGLWDRISDRTRESFGRILCAVVCAWIAWMSAWGAAYPFAIVVSLTACVAVGGLLAPQLGVALALLAFTVATILGGAPLIGTGLIIVSIAWWIFFGRRSIGNASLPFAAPLLGFVSLTPAFPLLCGFCLPVKRAFAASLFGGLLMIVISACTGFTTIARCGISYNAPSGLTEPFIAVVSNPANWIMLVGWVFAA